MTVLKNGVLQSLGFFIAAFLAMPAALGADRFVDSTGAGGAYTTIQAAFTAAGANDTIWVRGGQSFNGTALSWGTAKSGVKIYGGWNGNTGSPSSNAFTNANDPTNLANANTARASETVWTGGQFANIGNAAGDAVSGIAVRGFTFSPSSAANVISVSESSPANVTRTNLDFSNNVFNNLNSDAIAVRSGTGSSTNGILLSGNRVTLPSNASGKTAFALGSTAAFATNVTITGNYVTDNAGTSGNNRAMNLDMVRNGVIANNVFNAMSNQSVGNINSALGVVVADNTFLGGGKTQRGVIAAPRVNDNSLPAGTDADVERLLISNNQFSGHVGQAIDLSTFTGSFTGDDGYEGVWIRHNRIDADANQYQSSTFNAVSALSVRVPANTQGNGPITIENNEINIVNNRTTLEMQAIRLAGDLPTTATGGLVIRNNSLTATGTTTGVPYVGVRFDPVDASFGNMGAVNVAITNNSLTGFPTAIGVYDTLTSGSVVVGSLAAGSTVTVDNNNFSGATTDIVNGSSGPNITGAGNYYSAGAATTSGNVSTNSTSAAELNTVVGRNASYVTFRGDFNLSNDVDSTDAAVIVANFGQKTAGVTYFQGDATLDQEVTLDDGKVYARFVDDSIEAGGTITNPASAGAPTISYDPATGQIFFSQGAQAGIWGLSLLRGTTALTGILTPTALNANWFGGSVSNALELGDSRFGELGNFATASPNTLFGTVQTGLTASDFGSVEYYFGQDALVSSAFTTVSIVPVPEPGTLALLAIDAGGLAFRRSRIRLLRNRCRCPAC